MDPAKTSDSGGKQQNISLFTEQVPGVQYGIFAISPFLSKSLLDCPVHEQ
jgi:hypothetical protein